MKLNLYQIDAFADKVFNGNPAAVCLLEEWLPEATMQNIALENNLSETSFLVPKDDGYEIRWFTPKAEVDLCGHATLASAALILKELKLKDDLVNFYSPHSGLLSVSKDDDWLVMDFPARMPETTKIPPNLERVLGCQFIEVLESRDLFVVLENEKTVKNLKPDIESIKRLDCFSIIVTAKADQSEENIDFVSRFFIPKLDIAEDPVTGSAHSSLIPYLAEKLGKKKMLAKQLSSRGGLLKCEYNGDRVKIAGKAICYLRGKINF
ncbi:MAG: PhzF family phenazine biosynthesis protein [Vampirovibrionia bacterium]